ncbi:MAG: ABC-F family ATP-binding cassette domain-containing protein [Actinomycetaceae bacterium]|nr:ABC-F family ATP-binding cassette domain-containing protein [Actinomycetaceae bacterium]
MRHTRNLLSPDSPATGVHLRLEGLSFAYAERRVLSDITFTVDARQRLGLIGENGCGKTTLLRLIADVLTPSKGTVLVHSPSAIKPRIGLLHQEPPFSPDQTITQALEDATTPVRQAAANLDETAQGIARNPDDPQALQAYANALEQAERLDVWGIDARVSAMLDGLGLDVFDRARPTGTLSGGQRARLALAWLLLNAPDILLLDEPTNHLDAQATAFLVDLLRTWKGPVIVASHDRAFMDEALTTLIDLDPCPLPHALTCDLLQDGTGSGIGVTRFSGNYSDYLRQQARGQQRWHTLYREEQEELKRLRTQVQDSHVVGHADWKPRTEGGMATKFYADRNARVVTRRVKDAERRLADLERTQIRKPPAPLSFSGLMPVLRPPKVPGTIAISKAYIESRLAPTSFTISEGEKLLITGENGCGKSSLLAAIAGELPLTSGSITIGSGLRVALLHQNLENLGDLDGADAGLSVEATYRNTVGTSVAETIPLGSFGLIAPRDVNRRTETLSTGQRRRLALAVVLAKQPDVLLLDEPTNHFSLSLVTALEEAIPSFPGTVIVASHDRWLRKNWGAAVLELPALGNEKSGS